MSTRTQTLLVMFTILGSSCGLPWQTVAVADDAQPVVDDAQPVATAEEGDAGAESDGAVSEEQINELIRQLNDDKFAARQAATKQLADAGAAAVPALIKAAQGDELEVTTRAFNIFERHLKGGDAAARTAVRAALPGLAASENEAIASRAAKLLEQPKLGQGQPGGIRIGPGGGIQIGGGGRIQIGGGGKIQIQVQAIGGGNKKFRMQNVNGVKEIDAEEDGRKVKIVDDPNKGIKMQVTETKDGKEQTKKYEAKSADELQKNHPEAHKLYKKYSQGNGIGAQFGGGIIQQRIQIGPNGIQVLPKKPRARKADDEKDDSEADDADAAGDKPADDKQADAFGDAKKQLKELSKLIENQAGGNGAKELEAALEQLEQLQQQIEQLQEAE